MAMVIAILLGMGLPTPIAYLISGIFVAPAVVEVGFPELAAHMFVFFFAIKSGSTPPIAIGAATRARPQARTGDRYRDMREIQAEEAAVPEQS